MLALIVYAISNTVTISLKSNPTETSINIYFLDPVANMLKPEKRTVPLGDNAKMANNAISYLYEGPKSKNSVKAIPDNIKLQSARIVNETTFEANFSADYIQMPPIQELFFRTSFVWTMTDLGFIEQVHIYVDGEELTDSMGKPFGMLNRTNTVINAVLSPDKDELQMATLYFTDAKAKTLIPEQRYINVNPDKPIERFILEQLITGPKEKEVYPTLSSEIKIRDVTTEKDTCYVNLSNDFLVKQVVAAGSEKIAVYSIINSLTELRGITKVQFLIESEKVDTLKGIIDLSKPLERDIALIEDNI